MSNSALTSAKRPLIWPSRSRENGPFTHNQKGFQALLKHLSKEDYVVMEASGPYYLPLATYLYQIGYQVVVAPPWLSSIIAT